MFVIKRVASPDLAVACAYSARAHGRPRTARAAKAKVAYGPRAWPAVWVFGFLLLHLPLALLMRQAPWLAGAHALGTLALGLWLCARRPHAGVTVQWLGYVVGSEVLWRMCHAPIPWQFAEYLICFVSGVLLLRARACSPLNYSKARRGLQGFTGNQRVCRPGALTGRFLQQPASRRPWLPILYLGLLLPASLIPFATLPFDEARQAVSFNLSGPVCFAFCALRCSSLTVNVTTFERLGFMLLGPIGGVAFLGFLGLATTEDVFSNNANFVASGGYGPNQVSALIGLGGLLAMFLYLGENRSWLSRLVLAGLALGLLAQSAFTFSRTGLYLFTAAVGVAAAFLLQAQGKTLRLLLLLAILVAVTGASLPLLNAFTGGKLVERFSDTGLTGRDTIAKMELQIWWEHLVLGAGAGMSEYLRASLGDPRPAHTEYTRLLAEHGLLGLGAFLVLLLMTAQAFLRARGPWAKAIVSACAVWAFLFMAASAMRLAAPAFLLGLIQARFLADGPARVRAAGPIRRFI